MKELLKNIVLEAGKILRQGFLFGQKPMPAHKHEKELTTQWDIESERLIVDKLQKNFPDYSILTEESGLIDKNSEYTFVLDPLDGTGNFLRGNPLFAISLALKYKTEPILSLGYVPMLGEFYEAEAGKGFYFNGERASVSSIDNLADGYLLFCEGGEKNRQRAVKIYSAFRPEAVDFRKIGSAFLELAYVARGKADGYLTTSIPVWDVLAGVLFVKEAGGLATDFKGQELNFENKTLDLAASNKKLHSAIINRAGNL